MHFLIGAAGSAGDVFPFIAIGQALAARGHAVDVMAAAPFEAAVRGAGLGYLMAGTPADYERIVASPDLWHPARAFPLIVREMLASLPESVERARAAVRPDTVLVGSTLAWGTRLLQEQRERQPRTHGRPAPGGATVHLSPSCILSAEAPPVFPGLGSIGWLPLGARRWLLGAVERRFLDRLILPGLNDYRATLGLPPVARVMSQWCHSPDAVIGAWPEWFGPRQSDWPRHSVTTGFPFWRRPESAFGDPALDAFLAAGPPPVGITPGSAMAHGRAFFARALAACDATGRRALLITPYADQLPARLPPSAHHVAYAPFEWLVPRLAALVHHGGIGTCAQALAAGTPQLICPFAHDQFDNAARIERLGVGATVSRRAGQWRWTRALRGVVDDAGIAERCASLRDRMTATGDAASGIALRLISLRQTSAPPERGISKFRDGVPGGGHAALPPTRSHGDTRRS